MPIETGHSLNNFRENIKAIWRSKHNNNFQNEFMISILLEIKHQPNVQNLRDTTDCRRQFIQTSDYQRHHSIIGEVKDKSHQPHIPSRDILKKADHCENEPRWIDHEIITDRIVFMHSTVFGIIKTSMFIFGSIRQENLGDSLKSVVELRHIRFQDFLKTLRDLKRT